MMSRAASVVCQPLVRAGEFAGEPGDLGLLGGELADLLAGFLAGEDPGVALFAPFADQRGVQALPAQIRPAVAVLAGLLVGAEVRELVSAAVNARRRRGPSALGCAGSIAFIVVR